MIKKALLPALALAAASVAVPAAAQSLQIGVGVNAGYDRGYGYGSHYDRDYNWRSINQRQAQLDQRIDRSLRNGAISRREAPTTRKSPITKAT